MMRVAMLFFLAMTVAAQAQGTLPATTSAAGNLPAGFYPKSPCIKPGPPEFGRKPDQREIRKVEAYNEKIRAYNKAMEAFNPCIQDYAARANHDMQEIRAAVAAANAD